MATPVPLTALEAFDADARRIEECSLNAAGPFQSLVYDGWLVGYRRGRAKRQRCINAFYPSTLPVQQKIEYCARFYEAGGLPALFRLSPYCQPESLDAMLDRAGWRRFEQTSVMRTSMSSTFPGVATAQVQIVPASAWIDRTATLLGVDATEASELAALADGYPLPQVGALIRADGEVVAGGMMRVEGDCAGLYSLATAPPMRGRGLGRSIVVALLEEAARHSVRVTYLQVTSTNAPARTLYSRLGFVDAYDYWYRSRSGEDR